MKKILIGAVAASVLAATAAYADNGSMANFSVTRAGTWYVAPQFGIYMPENSRGLENSATGGLIAGYNFDENLAVQAMFLGMTPATQNSNGDGGDSESGYLLNVEGVVNMPLYAGSRVVPYLALGTGMLKLQSARGDIDFGGGVNYYIGPNTSLGLNYRLINQTGSSYRDNLITAGISFGFGDAKMVSAPAQTKSLTPRQQAMMSEAASTLSAVLPNGVAQCSSTVTPEQGCVTLSADQMVMHLDVKFANNQASIGGNYPSAINRVGTFMNQYPQTSAVLYGYASKVGTEQYNQKLSLRRAEKVKAYLVSQGVDASRLSTVGMGTQNPIASNASKVGRAANRRVEAAIPVPLKSGSSNLNSEPAPAPVKPQAAKA